MKKGMTKVSVLYPNGSGKKFDMDYYLNSHVPLVAKTLGDALKGASYDKGLAGGAPILMGDLPNFTNIEPEIQINEVVA